MYRQLIPFFLFVVCSTSCSRTPSDVWRDSKSASRHMGRGVNTLGGKHGESRQVRSSDDFDGASYAAKQSGDDFIALEDANQDLRISDQVPQSKEAPGELGSAIPGIEGFSDPASNPRFAAIFKNVLFDYNSSLVKGDSTVEIVQNVADYMRANPNVYVFVEGHCDKRGPTAYNYALGANRSNCVRTMLVKEGVDQDRVFTISYGKDQLLVEGDIEDAHTENRRCQFKIYMR